MRSEYKFIPEKVTDAISIVDMSGMGPIRFFELMLHSLPVQAYVSQLAAVPQASLSESNVKLVVIGCGEWGLIENYKSESAQAHSRDSSHITQIQETTGFNGDIYADPSRELYHKLGMTTENLKTTPAGQQKRSYVPGMVSNVLKSIWASSFHVPIRR